MMTPIGFPVKTENGIVEQQNLQSFRPKRIDQEVAAIASGQGFEWKSSVIRRKLIANALTPDEYQAIFRAYRQGPVRLGTAARDLTIRCEGRLVHLNRTLFKCLSPLLTKRMGASVHHDKRSQEVVLSGIPYSTLQLLCDYLHGVPIAVPQDKDELSALIHLVELSDSSVLNMPEIAAACDSALAGSRSLPNRMLWGIMGNGMRTRCSAQRHKEYKHFWPDLNRRLIRLTSNFPMPELESIIREGYARGSSWIGRSTSVVFERESVVSTNSAGAFRDRNKLLSIATHALGLSVATSSSGPSASERERYLQEEISPSDLYHLFMVLVQEDSESKHKLLLAICGRLLAQHFYAGRLSVDQALLVWQLSRFDHGLRAEFDYERITFIQDCGTEHENYIVLPRLPCLIFCKRLRTLAAGCNHVVLGTDLTKEQLDRIQMSIAEANEQDSMKLLLRDALPLEDTSEEALLTQEIITPDHLHRLLKLAIDRKSDALLNRCIEAINALYRRIVRIKRRSDKSLSLSVKDEDKMDESLKGLLIALRPYIQEASIYHWPTQTNLLRKGLSKIQNSLTNRTITILAGLLVANSIFSFFSHLFGNGRTGLEWTWDNIISSGPRLYTNITELNWKDGTSQAAFLAVVLGIGVLANQLLNAFMSRLVADGRLGNHYDFFRTCAYEGIGLSRPEELSTQLIQKTRGLSEAQEANLQQPSPWCVQQLPRSLRSLDISVCREQLTNEAIAIIVRRFPQLESLTIAGPCPLVDARGWAHLAFLKRLKRLHITLNPAQDPFKPVLSDLNLAALAPYWPNFEQIEIGIDIRRICIQGTLCLIPNEHSFLRTIPEWPEVIINYKIVGMMVPTHGMSLAVACPNVTRILPFVPINRFLDLDSGRRLRTLCLNEETESAAVPFTLAYRCLQLEDLRLVGMHFTPEQMRQIGEHGRNLRHLQFRNCPDITNDGLKSLAALPKLKTLEVIGSNPHLSDDSVRVFNVERKRLGLPPIEYLGCLGCNQISMPMVQSMLRSAIPHQERYLNSLKLPTFDLSSARDNPQQFFSRMDFYMRNAGYFLKLYAKDAERGDRMLWIGSVLRSVASSFGLPPVRHPRMN